MNLVPVARQLIMRGLFLSSVHFLIWTPGQKLSTLTSDWPLLSEDTHHWGTRNNSGSFLHYWDYFIHCAFSPVLEVCSPWGMQFAQSLDFPRAYPRVPFWMSSCCFPYCVGGAATLSSVCVWSLSSSWRFFHRDEREMASHYMIFFALRRKLSGWRFDLIGFRHSIFIFYEFSDIHKDAHVEGILTRCQEGNFLHIICS